MRLPRFERLDADRVRFFAERRSRVVKSFPAYSQLRSKLLAIGGLEVVLPLYHELSAMQRKRQRHDTARILEEGRNWAGGAATLKEMEDSSCHVNSALLFRQGKGAIATGYGLSEDGLWREHSWILGGDGRLVETTVPRLLYHGYALSAQEQEGFAKAELEPDSGAGISKER